MRISKMWSAVPAVPAEHVINNALLEACWALEQGCLDIYTDTPEGDARAHLQKVCFDRGLDPYRYTYERDLQREYPLAVCESPEQSTNAHNRPFGPER